LSYPAVALPLRRRSHRYFLLPAAIIASSACSARSTDPELGLADAAAIEGAITASPSAKAAPETEPTSAESSPCPADMVLVAGEYCPEVRHTCLRWLDPPGTYETFRCAQYGKPTCASSQRVPMRFCIDRDEWTKTGEALPAAHQSWTTAKAICESQGKSLCLESEWQFACEGEEMRPYPYGFTRDASACNIDRTNLGRPNSGLRDLREPAGSHPRCVSPFGVRDMSGNVEEWATLDHPSDPRDKSTMKGAWWLPGRNTCRAATTGHGETYEGPQVGVRCCKAALR
jgi:formylglycine-generating enzyme